MTDAQKTSALSRPEAGRTASEPTAAGPAPSSPAHPATDLPAPSSSQGEGAVAAGPLRPAAALAPALPRPPRRRPDFRQLHKKLEATLADIQKSEEIQATLQQILHTLVRDFGDDLGLLGGRLYHKQGKKYVLVAQSGRGRRARPGFSVSTSYKPLERLAQQGYVFSRKGDPDFDPRIEGPLGIRAYAAIGVGERNRYLISFTLRRRFAEEQIIYALNAVRHVVNMKIQQERLEDILWEAREIQMSMLPREVPRFKGYELYGRSTPAEVVGGDLFDYIPIAGRVLGVAVADSRGHGLPASLLARDVIVGLRMGAEMHFKMVTTIEKLNRIIARSALATQFVSLFYGELEHNGNLIYCNAGHHPGLLLRGDRILELHKGGLLLGPNPDSHYERGFVVLRKGDLLLLYTDGVVEALSPAGEEFGAGRLKEMLVDGRALSARELTQRILSRTEEWCHPARPKDDRTVVVVRRTD